MFIFGLSEKFPDIVKKFSLIVVKTAFYYSFVVVSGVRAKSVGTPGGKSSNGLSGLLLTCLDEHLRVFMQT